MSRMHEQTKKMKNYMLERIRIMRGMTEKELGLKAGFNDNRAERIIQQYESGRKVPDIPTLKRIADALDVRASVLRNADPEKDELAAMYALFRLHDYAYIRICENKDVKKWPFFNQYYDNDSAIYIEVTSLLIEDFLKQWIGKIKSRYNSQITDNEYIEWIAKIPDNFYSRI